MMFTMPVYDMMLLPGVTFYFKKDIFQQMGNQDAKAGDDVLFLMQRTDKDRKDLTPEDFYPVGVSGKLDSVDNEGNIRIRTVARVIYPISRWRRTAFWPTRASGPTRRISPPRRRKRFSTG